MVLSIWASHSMATWRVKKQLKMVVSAREWSCSYAQLALFVDVCGAILVKFSEGELEETDPLVEQARVLELLGLIAVERDEEGKYHVIDGDLVLLTNHLLEKTGQRC